MTLHRLACVAAVALAAGCGSDDPAGPTDAATVSMRSSSFSPRTVRLNVNGTVTWRNTSGIAHTSTSDDDVWDSGSVGSDDTFARTFPSAGTFDYHCTLHPGMTGTVIVE